MTTARKTPHHTSHRTAGIDAVKLLTEDHKEVKRLFKDYDKLCKADAPADERQALASLICGMLVVHTQVEEELFYPAARDALGDDGSDLLDEATVEHGSAKALIQQIQGASPDDDLYDAQVTVLGEYIAHHVEEEEGELFPKVKKAEIDLKALGEQMKERKEALMQELGLEMAEA